MLIYVIKMATLKLTILNLLFLIDSIEKFSEKRSALQFYHPSISPYKLCEKEGKLGGLIYQTLVKHMWGVGVFPYYAQVVGQRLVLISALGWVRY